MEIEGCAGKRVICADAYGKLHKFLVEWEKIAVQILRGFWASNDTARHQVSEMCSGFRWDVIDLGENGGSRWTFASSFEYEV